MQWYDYVFWVIAFIIIVLGLLQGGKSEGASGAITGGGLNVFVKTKERGSELIISYLTLGFGIVFLFFALLMEPYMWIVWLVILVAALIVEAVTFDLVSIWFAIAALFSLIFSFIPGLPFWGEIIIFTGISLILLIATRPFVKKFMNSNQSKSNLDLLINTEHKLLKQIDKFSVGELKINGVIWDCETEDGSIIEKGKLVQIISIKGNKLIVKEVKSND